METRENSTAIIAAIIVVILAFAAGCTTTPRGVANQGVSDQGQTRATHNSNYYLGADANTPRSAQSGGP